MTIKSIRQRADAATSGPWAVDPTDDRTIHFNDPQWVKAFDWPDEPDEFEWQQVSGAPGIYNEGGHNEADAAFIAHARTDIPALLRVAEAARVLEASHPCQHDGIEDASECPVLGLRAALADLEALP